MDITFIVNRIFADCGLSTYAWNEKNEMHFKATAWTESLDSLESDKTILKELRERWSKQNMPVILMEDAQVYYIAFEDKTSIFYTIGPGTNDYLNVLQTGAYKSRHGVQIHHYFINKVNVLKTINLISLIYYLMTGVRYTELELMQNNQQMQEVSGLDAQSYQMNLTKQEFIRNPYAFERDLLHAIATGDLGYMDRPFDNDYMDGMGKMARENLKQMEYLTVSTIAIATRAAINGGMPPREAYNLSDLYLQKTELCTSVTEYQMIMGLAVRAFIQKMNKLLAAQRNADYIERCKEYIVQNYHHPIKVEDIARKLGMNRTYLSRKFSEQTGITIKDYIIKKRMEAASNLLKYSEDRIADISAYLCFNSQSHFGELFRREYKMTPIEYRRKYKTIEFISKS